MELCRCSNNYRLHTPSDNCKKKCIHCGNPDNNDGLHKHCSGGYHRDTKASENEYFKGTCRSALEDLGARNVSDEDIDEFARAIEEGDLEYAEDIYLQNQ